MKRLSSLIRLTIFYFLILTPAIGLAQNYQPATEYMSLLNQRLHEQYGSIMIDNLQIVFPPQTQQPIEIVASKPMERLWRPYRLGFNRGNSRFSICCVRAAVKPAFSS